MQRVSSLLVLALAFVALATLSGSPSAAASPAAADPVALSFANHIQADLPEQDVFIESADDATMVMRVEGAAGKDSANLAKAAYATAGRTEHDPFKMSDKPLGPFPKGQALGFTLGEWLAATGSGTYTPNGDSSRLQLSLQKLVPNGVYTVWCSRLTFPPNVKILDYPCGAADGSENKVTADASGGASFDLALGQLPDTTKETASLVALAYHSDGQTYGAEPGDFGSKTHVQIFAMVPAPAAEMPAAMPVTGAGGAPDTSLLWLVALVVIAVGWLAERRGRRQADSGL